MTEARSLIIAEALTWTGTPYHHQASLKGVGCDCLGLVRGVWRAVYGEEPELMPAYSADWAEASGQETLLQAARRHLREVPVDQMQPGDVLLFRWRPHLPVKHCAVLVAPDRIVHAYDSVGKVAVGNLAAGWKRRIAAVFVFPEV